MSPRSSSHQWIFVSHASEDLPRVREVRNYLEANGASPLLFHLLALDDPAEFWPLIEREITVRNFFLHCETNVSSRSRLRNTRSRRSRFPRWNAVPST